MSLRSRLMANFLLFLGTLGAVLVVVLAVDALSSLRHVPSPTQPAAILSRMPKGTAVAGGRAQVQAELLRRVRAVGGFLQVLDAEGRVIFAYRVPAGMPRQYPPGLLAELRLAPETLHYSVYTWYNSRGRITWLLGLPYPGPAQPTAWSRLAVVETFVLESLVGVLVAALVFAWRLGTPLLHALDWLSGIARGDLDEPRGSWGGPRSRRVGDGRLRGSYRIFREVFTALAGVAAAIRRSSDERGRLDRERDEWIAGVSHDIKTPLATVQGYAALLEDANYTWEPEEVRRFGAIMRRQATHLGDLVDDLSLSSRLRGGEIEMHPAPTDLVELVRRAVIDLVNSPGAEGREVRFECPEEPITYSLDAKWFRRAIDNLVANAALHNPAGTVITVRILRTGDGGTRIAIEDTGVGMDQETAARMFQRYFRGTDTSDAEGRGSGLGCAIAKGLIEAAHGAITVRTAPGQGTEVEIALPAQA